MKEEDKINILLTTENILNSGKEVHNFFKEKGYYDSIRNSSFFEEPIKVIRLMQFGCQSIQDQYEKLCQENKIDFEHFKDRLEEDTELTYEQLKEYWVWDNNEEEEYIDRNKMNPTIIDKYLIIHFNPEEKEIVGINLNNHSCLIFEDNYYDE